MEEVKYPVDMGSIRPLIHVVYPPFGRNTFAAVVVGHRIVLTLAVVAVVEFVMKIGRVCHFARFAIDNSSKMDQSSTPSRYFQIEVAYTEFER